MNEVQKHDEHHDLPVAAEPTPHRPNAKRSDPAVPGPLKGKELLERRMALGYSRAIFAEILGVAPFMVEAWERGIAHVENPDWLLAALDALEASRRDVKLGIIVE